MRFGVKVPTPGVKSGVKLPTAAERGTFETEQ
jgi:hypothetical protein